MRSEHELGDFTPIRRSLMVALDGDLVAAYVWAHIRFRGQLTDGKYQATQETLMDDLVIKRDRLRRALAALRDGGWLTWGRSDWSDATHIYETHDPCLETQPPDDCETQSSEDRETQNSIYLQELEETLRKERRNSTDLAKATPTVSPRATESANLLADRITGNGSKRPKITDAWLLELDRMNRIDGRSWDEIDGAIRWAQASDFWKPNIQSPRKLRKHFDTMRLQAQRGEGKPKGADAAERLLAQMHESKEIQQ